MNDLVGLVSNHQQEFTPLIKLFIVMTFMMFLPTIIFMMTSFVRIIITFSFLKHSSSFFIIVFSILILYKMTSSHIT